MSRETAETLTALAKDNIKKIAQINCGKNENSSAAVMEENILSSLSKLSFTMTDRASNEKLANKMLIQWRDEMLENCSADTERKSVKNFYCMAHVLLGFHKYVCDDLKTLEKEVLEQKGPVGRDSLAQFKSWSQQGTLVERAIRTSDTFGPVGDYPGVRD